MTTRKINTRTIVSGTITLLVNYNDWWWNTVHNRPFLLWTEISHGDDFFAYHMVTNYSDIIYDPALGVNKPWQGADSYIDEVFRYYYNTACENNSPPSDPPGIWDWGPNEMPNMQTPSWNNIDDNYNDNCKYPR